MGLLPMSRCPSLSLPSQGPLGGIPGFVYNQNKGQVHMPVPTPPLPLCPPLSWLCLAIISVPPVGHDTVGWAGCVQWDGMGKREARHMRRLTENRENHVKINHKLVSDPTGLSSRSPSIHLMIRVIIRDYHF